MQRFNMNVKGKDVVCVREVIGSVWTYVNHRFYLLIGDVWKVVPASVVSEAARKELKS